MLFTPRLICAWSENPSRAASPTSGSLELRIAFQAIHARFWALKEQGEVPNTVRKPRDTDHADKPLDALHSVMLMQGS